MNEKIKEARNAEKRRAEDIQRDLLSTIVTVDENDMPDVKTTGRVCINRWKKLHKLLDARGNKK